MAENDRERARIITDGQFGAKRDEKGVERGTKATLGHRRCGERDERGLSTVEEP